MKRFLLAGLGLAALAGTSALAADLPPMRMPPPRAPAYVPFFSWNGFYVGVNAGYGWGTSSWTAVTGATTGTFNIKGPQFGGTVGYNMQFGSAVFGIEGDYDWSGIKGTMIGGICAGNCETKNPWMATVRGRIGYAFDRFLPFFTGGAAFGGVKIAAGANGTASTTKTGWTVGGGVEYAFMGNWSAKFEYLYVDLGKATCDVSCSATPFDVTFKTNIVRGGVNYKF